MDATHLHLALTHFPIIGTIVGVLILTYGLYSKNDSVIKASLGTFVLMAILTIPVFLTGEPAAETVENLPGVSENIIEEHEELAEKAIWLMGLLGILSIFGLYAIYRKLSFSKIITTAVLIISLATSGLFAYVGNLGGQIRHTEIRTNATNAQSDNNTENKNSPNGEEDKDDD